MPGSQRPRGTEQLPALNGGRGLQRLHQRLDVRAVAPGGDAQRGGAAAAGVQPEAIEHGDWSTSWLTN